MNHPTATSITAKAWESPKALPLPRASYAAGVVNGSLVLAGGSYWQNGEKIRTTAVHLYDLANQQWSEGRPLPAPLAESASSSDGHRIYVVGGRHAAGITSNCLEYYDNCWIPMPDLPEPVTMGALAVANEDLYLLGGLTIADNWDSATNNFQLFHANQWTTLPPLPSQGIVTHSTAIWNNELFCFGGASMKDGVVENTPEIHSYSMSENHWRKVANLPKPLRALSAAVGPDSIFLFGGYGTTFENNIYKFNPQTAQIVEIGQLPMGIADCKFFYSAPWWVGAGGEPGPRQRSHYTWQAKYNSQPQVP